MEILNHSTGELESKRFTEDVTYISTGKQGWRKMYVAYDDVQSNLKSQREIKMFIHIRNLFTKRKSNVGLNKTKLSKVFGCSREVVSRFVGRLEKLEFIRKQSDDTYKMNPFMFIPYQGSAKELQDEWEAETMI